MIIVVCNYIVAYAFVNFFSLFLLGVLIPMLSFWDNRVEIDVKFSNKCVDYDIKDGYDTNEGKGATSLDNINRVAGNMFALNVYDLPIKQFHSRIHNTSFDFL